MKFYLLDQTLSVNIAKMPKAFPKTKKNKPKIKRRIKPGKKEAKK